MISVKQFDETLRGLARREPFVPFVVELEGGKSLTIPGRPIVFCDGAATHITPNFEMIEFTNDQVVAIRPIQEAVQ